MEFASIWLLQIGWDQSNPLLGMAFIPVNDFELEWFIIPNGK